LHALVLKIITESHLYLSPQQKLHLKYIDMGHLHEGAGYSRTRPIPLKISLTQSATKGIFKKFNKLSVIRLDF
jgi:hypothetical protein